MIRTLAAAILMISAGVSNAVAKVITYDCSFSLYASTEGVKKAEQGFSMKFQIDTISREAYMVGNAGLAKVEIFIGDSGITFLEKLATGAVQTTTITGKGDVVHSRHTIILPEIVPTQYYGKCTAEK